MLFLMLAELIIAGCVLMAGNISGNQKAKNIGKHLVKQGFITFVLFNIFNISFSAGVHSKYAR